MRSPKPSRTDSFSRARTASRGDAIVLAGGVAKGAFAAGAVLALAQRVPLRVRRIVATSWAALRRLSRLGDSRRPRPRRCRRGARRDLARGATVAGHSRSPLGIAPKGRALDERDDR